MGDKDSGAERCGRRRWVSGRAKACQGLGRTEAWGTRTVAPGDVDANGWWPGVGHRRGGDQSRVTQTLPAIRESGGVHSGWERGGGTRRGMKDFEFIWHLVGNFFEV